MKNISRRRLCLTMLAAVLLGTTIIATRSDNNALAIVDDCPRIRCADRATAQPIRFRVFGGLSETNYRWSVSTGSISGPSTGSQINVASIPRGPCTATVRMAGIRSGCPRVLRCTTFVGPCPGVIVSCPGSVKRGQPATFGSSLAQSSARTGEINSAHASPQSVTYNWSISAGEIISGQGTPSIRIDTSGLPVGTSITATLEVQFVDGGCSRTASCTTVVTRN